MQNVCDGGCIKHGSDFSCVCDSGHTVNPFELFAMRQNNRNGQPYQCVCNIWHTVCSDELFAIRESNKNGQPDQGVCDIWHAVHSALSLVCDLCGNRSLPTSLFVYRGNRPPLLRLFLSIWNCCRTLSSLHLPSPFLLSLFDRLLHGANRPETTPLFLPRSER